MDHVTLTQHLQRNGKGRNVRTQETDIAHLIATFGCSWGEAKNACESVLQANDGT